MKRIGDYLLEIVLAMLTVFVLVLLVAPYFFGYLMQSDYKSALQDLSANTKLSYEVVSYERNWFNTDADLLIKDTDNNILFYIRQQIIHGPLYLGLLLKGRAPWVSMVIKGKVLFDKKDNTVFSKLFPAANAVSIDSIMRFNDDAIITISIPAVNDKVKGQEYKFSGIDFDVEYFSDENRFLGELGVHELQVNGSGMLELKDLILSFNQSISSDNAAGDFVVSFDILKFDFKKNLFDIRQFSSRLKNIKKSNIISASVGLKVSKINLFSEQISSLSMDIASSGFEYNILKKNFLSMLSDDKNRMYHFGYNDYHYDSFITDRLDFFTEHGGFSSNLSLKNEQSGSDVDESYFSGKSIEMNVSAGDVLLRKIYKLITMNYEKDTVNKPKLFVKSLLKMKYIKNINNKYKFSLRNKEGKFIINNLYVTYDDFLQSFSSAVFIK